MFGRELDRIEGPCMWGIITVWFCLMTNVPYFPGVGTVGVYIDRCIIDVQAVHRQHLCDLPWIKIPSKCFQVV